jgi:hypothetical protein
MKKGKMILKYNPYHFECKFTMVYWKLPRSRKEITTKIIPKPIAKQTLQF